MDPIAAVRLATSLQEPVGRRLSKLKALKQHASQSFSSAKSGQAPFWLLPSLQQLLPLLQDPHAEIRSAAVPLVSLLGTAWLSKAAQRQQGSADRAVRPTLIFDSIASAVCGEAAQGAPPPLPQRKSLLAALTQAVDALPSSPTLSSQALSVAWSVGLRVLEDTNTSAALLPSLIDLLHTALRAEIRCFAAPAAPAAGSAAAAGAPNAPPLDTVLPDMVDLLLGWSLDPSVSQADRLAVHALFKDLRPYFQYRTSFALNVCTSLAQDLEAMADKGLRLQSTDQQAQQAQQQQSPPEPVDVPAALRLAGCLVALLQAVSPQTECQAPVASAPTVPTPATWGLLELYPRLLTALSLLLQCTQQEYAAVTQWQAQLAAARPAPAAPARRAQTAAKAEAEARLSSVKDHHSNLAAFVASALQQVTPLVRDLVEGGHVCWPLPTGLTQALSTPACPPTPALPPTAPPPTSSPAADSVGQTNPTNGQDEPQRIVAALVQDIFTRIAAGAGGPVGGPAAGHAPACQTQTAGADTDTVVQWAVSGAVELTLQALSHSLTQRTFAVIPQLLNTSAVLLCVADGVSEALCEQLAGDCRLLALRVSSSTRLQPGSDSAAGVWSLLQSGDSEVQSAMSDFVLDVLSMPGSVSELLFGVLLSDIQYLLAQPEQGTQLSLGTGSTGAGQPPASLATRLSALRTAASKAALTAPQLAQVCELLSAQLPQVQGTQLLPDVLATWSLCLFTKWFDTSTAQGPHSGSMADQVVSACQVVRSLLKQDTGAGGLAAAAWPAELLARLEQQQQQQGSVLSSAPVQGALMGVLDTLCGLADVQARKSCLQAVQCLVRLLSSGQQLQGTQGELARSDLLLRVSALALRLLGDRDAEVAAAALPVALSLCCGPLLALSAPGQPAACTQYVGADSAARQALQPPVWHDSCTNGTSGQAGVWNWRPVQLARLFGLLFPDLPVPVAADAAGAAGAAAATAGPDATAKAEQPAAASAPVRTPGLLLRRRPDNAPPATSQAPPPPRPGAGASQAASAAAQPDPQPAAASQDQAVPAPVPWEGWVDLSLHLSPVDTDTDPPAVNSSGTASTPPVSMPGGFEGGTGAKPGPQASLHSHHVPSVVWRVLQDAAASCVAARLRTHLGGPSQSLAAMERLLAALLSELQAASSAMPQSSSPAAQHTQTTSDKPGPQRTGDELHTSAWLALEFVAALERRVNSLVQGSSSTHGMPGPVVAFYAANRKVCDDWFQRTRALRVRIAAALSAHRTVVMQGWALLRDNHDAMQRLVSATLADKQPDAAGQAGAGSCGKPSPTLPEQRSAGQASTQSGKQQPTNPPAPTLLRKKPQPEQAPAAPAVAPGQSAAASAKPDEASRTHQALRVLVRDMVSALQSVAEAQLALGDWAGLEGLRAWANSVYARLKSDKGTVSNDAAVSAADAGGAEDPFLWLAGLSQMSLGRYEQALHHLTAYVRQQAQRQARLALLPQAAGGSQAAAAAPAAPAAQAPGQPRQALADVATAAFTHALGALQPTIAVHMAQCYAALSDWQHFRDFVAAQHRKAQTDPQLAAWWRPCMSTAQMQDICALGSFDVNGPLSPELKDMAMSPCQRALLSGLQTVHSLHTASNSAPDEQSQVAQQAAYQAGTAAALPAVREPLQQACWQGWHAGQRPGLTLTHLIAAVHATLTASGKLPDDAVLARTLPARCIELVDLLRSTPTARSLAALMLPRDAQGPGGLPLALPVLTQLLRVCSVLTRPTSPPDVQQRLLLGMATAARAAGNTDLAVRVVDKLSLLMSTAPTPSQGQAAASSATAQPLSRSVLSTALAAARVHVLAEAGGMPPVEAAGKQMAALSGLLSHPRDLLQLALDARYERLASRMRTAPDSTAQLTVVAAEGAAAGLVSLSEWLAACPAAAVASLASAAHTAAGSRAGPVALTDWVSVLKALAGCPLPMPYQASGATGANSDGTHASIVPQCVTRQHAFQACVHVCALHLAPEMPSAWLQWGQALAAWQREIRQRQQQQQQQPVAGGRQAAPQVASVQQEEEELASAAVCAYSMWLYHSWHHLAVPEDATPVLLKILQTLVRYGAGAEAQLQGHLLLAPAAAWQTLAPQLFAQLRHTHPGVRRLVLGLLKRVALAAPFSVLYPALAEVQSCERAGSPVLSEVQALLTELDSSHRHLMSDVRTLMVEAERLTITWEERWHSILSEMDVDVARRCVTLRAEADRLEQTWTAAKAAQALRSTAPSPSPAPATTAIDTAAPTATAAAAGQQAARGQKKQARDRKGPGGAEASLPLQDFPALQAAAAAPARHPAKPAQTLTEAAAEAATRAVRGVRPVKPVKQGGKGHRGVPVQLGAAPLPPPSASPTPVPPTDTQARRVNAWAAPLSFVTRTGQADVKPQGLHAPAAAPVPAQVTGWGAGGIQDIPDFELQEPAVDSTSVATGVVAGASQIEPADNSQTGSASQEDSAQTEEAAAEQRRSVLMSKYATVMSPVVLALERHLRACNACEPEAPAEQEFARTILPKLASAIATFKSPPAGVTEQLGVQPQACWAPVKSVLQQLDELLKRTTMPLAQYSPALAALVNTDLPMPGVAVTRSEQDTGGQEAGPDAMQTGPTVTIASVHPVLRPLFTKTRPKRLQLTGSDGQEYVFLLKGRDDLRMDERIMQILRVSNSLMRHDLTLAQLGCAARHYSVTPLGERVGLIQWVEHTTSLFSLFRDWQQGMRERQAAMQAARDAAPPAQPAPQPQPASVAGQPRRGPGGQTGGRPAPVSAQPAAQAAPALPPLPPIATMARPADLFYARLLAELRAAGLPGMVPRKQWPLAVLQRVFAGLTRQAPAQMVANQLRASSGSAVSWWAKQRSYAVSLAVNSMLGYLIGLGDRHLENILIDKASGELVHIDFNVCFEKGLQLRVPELVPFRMTQSLAAGLGAPGGVKGSSFHSTCCQVLSAVQRRREALVALLDAVLGDPLVAWSEAGGKEAAARRDLELAVSLTLFESRMEESREALAQQSQTLIALIQGPGATLIAFVQQYRHIDAMRAAKKAAETSLEQAKELATTSQSEMAPAMAAMQAAVVTHRGLQTEARGLQDAGAQLIKECNFWTAQHVNVLSAVRDESVPELSVPAQAWSFSASQLPILLVSDMPASSAEITPAGAILTVSCGDVAAMHEELSNACRSADLRGLELITSWDAMVTGACDALLAYGAMLRTLLPTSYPQQSYHYAWGLVMSGALAATSPQAMNEAKLHLPAPLSRESCERMWRAMHAYEDLAEDAATSVLASNRGSGADSPTNAEQTQQSKVMDMLASFAAAEEHRSLQSLCIGLAVSLSSFRLSFTALVSSCGEPEGLSSRSDSQITLEGGSARPNEPPSPTGTQRAAGTAKLHAQLSQRLASLHALLNCLNRVGLTGRLLPSARKRGSQYGAGDAHHPTFHVLQTALQAAQGTLAWCEQQGKGALQCALCPVAAHMAAGETLLLGQAAKGLAGISAHIEQLRVHGTELDNEIRESRQMHAALMHEKEALQASSGAGQDLQQQETLRLQIEHSTATQWQLHNAAKALHAQVAAAVQQAYDLLLGPCQLGADLCQDDEQAWQAHMTLPTLRPQHASASRAAAGLHFGNFSVLQETAAGAADTPSPHAQDTDAQPAAPPAPRLQLSAGQALTRSAPQADQTDWGSPKPHSILAGAAAVLLAAPLAGPTAAAPQLLDCWSGRLDAVQALADRVQQWHEQALRLREQGADASEAGAEGSTGGRTEAVLTPTGSDLQARLVIDCQQLSLQLSLGVLMGVADGLGTVCAALEQHAEQLAADSSTAVTDAQQGTAADGRSQTVGPGSSVPPPVLPELVAFQDFDPALQGEDMLLEDMGLGDSGALEETGAEQPGSDVPDAAATLAGTRTAQAAAGADAYTDTGAGPLPTQTEVAVALSDYLSSGLHPDGHLGLQHGTPSSSDEQLLRQYKERMAAVWLRQRAAFAWTQEHILSTLEGLPSATSAVEAYFAEVPWNPLEPTARLPVTSRQQIVMSLQSLCDNWTRLRDDLVTWERNSAQLAQAALSSLSRARPDMDASMAAMLVDTCLTRRASWMAESQSFAERLASVSAAVVQYEVSRQGAAWAPGSPLVLDSFAACYGLLQRIESVYAGLGDQHMAVLLAQDKCKRLQVQQQQAVATQHRDLAHISHLDTQLATGLPVLAMRGVQLAQVSDSLLTALPAASALLCKELGPVLRDLLSVTTTHPHAKDVASLTSAVIEQHSQLAEAIGALDTALPRLQQQLVGLSATKPLPGALTSQLQAGRLPGDPASLHALAQLGDAMRLAAQESVGSIAASMSTLTEAPRHLARFASSLTSLASAAGSVAAAMQSKHAHDESDGEGVDQGTATAAGAQGSETSGGSRQAALSLKPARSAWTSTARARESAESRQQVSAQRKAYAVTALRRCIQKLERKDVWDVAALTSRTQAAETTQPGGQPRSVAQQVDALITQAESSDNLCRMFEGWMAWL